MPREESRPLRKEASKKTEASVNTWVCGPGFKEDN